MFYVVSRPQVPFYYEDRSPEELYYRRLAQEHQRRANIALARARYQERLIAEQEEYLSHVSVHPYAYPARAISRHGDVHPFFNPLEHLFQPTSSSGHTFHHQRAYNTEQILRKEREARIQAALEARRQREIHEAREAQLREQQRRERIHHQQDVFQQLLAGFFNGMDQDPEQDSSSAQEKVQKPAERCSAAACKPKSEVPANPLEELFSALLGIDASASHKPSDQECDCQTCKRNSVSPKPVHTSTQSAGPTSSKGKGKAPEAPRNIIGSQHEQVHGHVLPLGLSAEERQEILSALGVAPDTPKKASQEAAPSKPARPSSIASIKSLETKFNSLKSSFDFPTKVDFVDTASVDSPALAFNSTNLAVNAYENDLNTLLTQIDEVESNGESDVREKRKSLVIAVENELQSLDKKKTDAWTKEHTDEPQANHSAATSQTEEQPEHEESPVSLLLTVDTSAPEEPKVVSEAPAVVAEPQEKASSETTPTKALELPQDTAVDHTRQRASSFAGPSTPTSASLPITRASTLPLDLAAELSSSDVDSESDIEEFSALIKSARLEDKPEPKEEVVGYELL